MSGQLKKLGLFAAVYVGMVLLFTLVLSTLDHTHFYGIDEKNDKGLNRFGTRLYFTLETVSTVGCGTVTPKGPVSKATVGVMMVLISITIFEVFLVAITAGDH
jgi:hypothetical protein